MRKLVSIQRIEAIEPIAGADKIVKARVMGWDVVVKKDEFRAGDPRMDGRGLAILQGDLYDVLAAQEIALSVLETRGIPAQHRVLTSPHDALLAQIAVSPRFDLAKPLALEGETAS